MGTSKKAPPGAPFSPPNEAPTGNGFDLDAFLEQDRSLSGVSPGEPGSLPAPLITTPESSAENWGFVISQAGSESAAAVEISSVELSAETNAAIAPAELASADWGNLSVAPAAELDDAELEAAELEAAGMESEGPGELTSVLEDFAPSSEPGLLQAPSELVELDAEPSFEPEPAVESPADRTVAIALEAPPAEVLNFEMNSEAAPAESGAQGTQVFALESDASSALPEMDMGAIDAMSSEVASSAVPDLSAAMSFEAPPSSPSLSGGGAPGESDTLRKYAHLKEREAFEREATNRALQNQIEQIRAKLSRSENERRRLTLALQESETLRRSLEDAKDQAKHHVHKVETHHQEEMRALQLRLDNAQFQAAKAEKKLEDFRERVRSDIQKIRLRERELANRLELQKRDAEALLTVKDEKLLQQKRDIDRLEYEYEILKERLVEDTERAEERMGRLSRALKAMKLASGLLSEIDEEVLPGSGDPGKRKGEAA